MATTVTIPLTTLPVGTFTAGPSAVADTTSTATLVIGRTVTNGFNSQPGTTTANLVVSQSTDGGVTWRELAEARVIGGTFGSQSTLQTTLAPGTGRQVKAALTVTGSSVAVSGALTIT